MKYRNLWEFTYEPKNFESMILNEKIKPAFEEALKTRPNMLIYGPPGVGKGTFVNILIKYHKLENLTLKINASDETGIDAIRDKVKTFAQAMSLGKLKLVYLNEADSLTSGKQGAQKMLRDLMEQTQGNTQFIFCCNYENYIIPELKSRCQIFSMSSPPANEIFDYAKFILKKEKVKFTTKALVKIVKKCYPDIRSTFVTMRQNVVNGELSEHSLIAHEQVFENILTNMKRDPGEVRKILKSNSIFYESLYQYLYQYLIEEDNSGIFKDEAQAIIYVAESSYRNNIVANKEIEFMGMYFKMLKDKTIVLV